MRFGLHRGPAAIPRQPVPVRRRPGTARSTGNLAIGFLMLGLALAAVLAGMLIGSGNLLLLAPIAGAAGLALVLMLPVTWTIWATFFAAMYLVGPLVYFAKLDVARWLPSALGLSLAIPLLIHLVGRSSASRQRSKTPMMLWWLGLFVVSVAFSTAIDNPMLGEVINFPRYYLVAVPFLLLLAFGSFSPENFQRAWFWLLGLAALQLPVALVQHFLFASRKIRTASWDAVVGTFPGNPDGGGASAGMGVFLITALVVALCLWQRRLLKARYLLAVLISAVFTVALAEVKAIVLLLPLVAGIIFYKEIVKKPIRSIAVLALSIVVMFGLLSVYANVQYADRAASWNVTNAPRSPLEAIQNQLDPNNVGQWTPSMGRVAALVDWWSENVRAGDIHHSLFGYGASATQANKLGVGELTRNHLYPLSYTTTAMLLWETGIVGHTLLVIGLLVAAASAAGSSRNAAVPDVHQALLRATAIAICIHVLTLPYRNFIMITSPNQFLIAFLIGYATYWERRIVMTSRDDG